MILSPKKKLTALLAVAMAAILLFGSTFAWQSISQEALNEIKGTINPGGRLHDDFNNITDISDPNATKTYDKDVYVENFTSVLNEGVQVYARVRLDEYMEIGAGAGLNSSANQAVSLIDGAQLDDKTTWETYVPGNNNAFRNYWVWTHEGGSTVYMPTFNKDNTSLEADINGTWDAGFTDHKDYTVGETETDNAYYAPKTQGGAQIIVQETHTAQLTINGDVITMAEWLQLDDSRKTGDFWVWDTDGWAYWANPIMPGTATGLLLDEIRRTNEVIEGEWYYGVNVVAQFITADDLGKETETGFYDSQTWTETAKQPSDNALVLLQTIGVVTDGSATYQIQKPKVGEASDESELIEAFETGDGITLLDDIVMSETAFVGKNAELYLDDNALYADSDFYGDALLTVCGGAWLDIDGGAMYASETGYAVTVEDDALVYIWDGSFAGGAGAIYVDDGEVVIFDGEFYQQDDAYGQLIDWNWSNYEAGKVSVTIYGGSFYNFDPADVNGVSLLADGYRAVEEVYGDMTVYTVVEGTESAEEELNAENAMNPDETTEGEEQNPKDGVTEDVAAEDGNTGDGTTEGENTEDGIAEGSTTEGETTEDVAAEGGSGDANAGNTSGAESSATSSSVSGIGGSAGS